MNPRNRVFLALGLVLLSGLLVICFAPGAMAQQFDVNARTAILVDAETGQVLFEKNPDERVPPASVVKIMPVLLTMEAIARGEVSLKDKVRTSAYASSIGGSQIWLKEGEEMTLEEMLKAIEIVSANDATVAVAEFLAGSEGAFIDRMNARARQLGMKNTHFTNTNGLPDPGLYTTARDITMMARELVTKHPKVLEWSSIWIDYLRGGKTFLRNTNELIVKYPGADGLKTGHTEEAGWCLVGTAKREGFRLISVVMGTPSVEARVSESIKLLDYGFRRFVREPVAKKGEKLGRVRVIQGRREVIDAVAPRDIAVLMPRGQVSRLEKRVESLDRKAPVKKGQEVGVLVVSAAGKVVARADLVAAADDPRANFLVLAFRSARDFIFRLFRVRTK